jgi:hypothetical protein
MCLLTVTTKVKGIKGTDRNPPTDVGVPGTKAQGESDGYEGREK